MLSGTATFWKSPKPVVIPYATRPSAAIFSVKARDCCIRRFAAEERTTSAPKRAAATKASSVRDLPSTVTRLIFSGSVLLLGRSCTPRRSLTKCMTPRLKTTSVRLLPMRYARKSRSGASQITRSPCLPTSRLPSLSARPMAAAAFKVTAVSISSGVILYFRQARFMASCRLEEGQEPGL